MKDSEFILGELQDFGVVVTYWYEKWPDGSSAYGTKINLEAVQFKHLGTVVNLFNELEDCVNGQ